MRSRIYLADKVPNTDRRFGSALEYYPVTVIAGKHKYHGFMTPADVSAIIGRGENNQEDVPPETWWRRLADWLAR